MSSDRDWIVRLIKIGPTDRDGSATQYRHAAIAIQERVVILGNDTYLEFGFSQLLRQKAILLESP